MKNLKLLLITVGLFFSVQIFAQDYTYKQDPWDSEKTNIIDSSGNNVGYYKVDAWDKGKINV